MVSGSLCLITCAGTPHSYHKDNALAAIAAGKHVLCEKPMTVTAAETEVMIAAAREKGVFLMEGKPTTIFLISLTLAITR